MELGYRDNGQYYKLADKWLNLSISGVEAMFRHKNLLAACGQTGGEYVRLGPLSNMPDEETTDKNFIFVHGYSNDPQRARGSQAQMFKRMFWSGSKARFYGVTWRGAETQKAGVTWNYHINVKHAFDTAQRFAQFIGNLQGTTIVAAHSLGNMVVSSGIHDHHMSVDKYFLIDAAVAIEAYEAGALPKNSMTHPDWWTESNENRGWENYLERTWASEWHKLFLAGDKRSTLTWRGRLATVGANAYNFYSSSEEVLGEHTGGVPRITDVVIKLPDWFYTGKYAWALQEKMKGRMDPGILICGSDYGGWGFNHVAPGLSQHAGRPLPAQVNALTPEHLQQDPVFNKGIREVLAYKQIISQPTGPSWLPDLFKPDTGSATAAEHRNQLLAEMFPARTLPAGANRVAAFGVPKNFDMPEQFKTGWPAERTFWGDTDWKHSDFLKVAYPYVHLLFDKFVTTGELK